MTQYTLRPYQQESVDRGVTFLSSKYYDGGGVLVLPTGAGKSLIIAGIVDRLDGPCLVFQPTKEILEQNHAKLKSYGYDPSIYSASFGRKEIGDITLATIGSVRKNPEIFKDVKYVIIDECDCVAPKTGMYKTFLEQLDGVRILGCTATPYRLSRNGYGGSILKFITRTQPRVFSTVVHCVQNGELFRSGYLCPLEYKTVNSGFDESKVRVNSTGADYTDESVRFHLDDIDFQEKVLKTVNHMMVLGRTGILVFTRFVKEAQFIADSIPGAQIVTGETKADERASMIRRFRNGEIPVIANVNVLSVGFDYPELSNVVLARPTMSLRLYYQMTGRAVRTHPNKKSAWIVDMVGLEKKFGKVEDLELRLEGRVKWAVFSGEKQLTNVYFGEQQQSNNRQTSFLHSDNPRRKWVQTVMR
jgi:DNA repair protein RadD